MATTTDLSTLKINYLTQEQYNTAKANGEINENEIYLTPNVSEVILSTLAPSSEEALNGTIWVQYID